MESKTKKGSLYLLPNLISEVEWQNSIPMGTKESIFHIRNFIVEDIRNARRYLRKIGYDVNFDEVEFFLLDKYKPENSILDFILPMLNGFDMAIVSESGLPCIADPGNLVVEMAHQNQIKVVPLVGPSSLFLALMASGFNGQNFTFNGYLPIENNEKAKTIKLLEKRILQENQTQIFIETPYRNQKLFDFMLKHCLPNLRLCIAFDITGKHEWIKTKSIQEWKETKLELSKQNCIFLLYK